MEKTNYLYGLTRFWWLPLLTGLIFIGFGVWCLCDPAPSLEILAYIFAGAIGAVGIFNLCYGLCNCGAYHGWGWMVGSGVIEILFSIFLFFVPAPILTWIFIYGVGFYIIFMAIYSFFDGFMMGKSSPSWMTFATLFLLGALVFACIFILGPGAPGLVGWLWIGVSFVCYGVYRVLLACRIKALNKALK